MTDKMTSKERALTTFARQIPDRIPINYFANPAIDLRLKDHFNLAKDDDEGLNQALHVDFRLIEAPYAGPKLHPDIPDRKVDEYGVRKRYIENESGGYWDYCDFPLKDATLEKVQSWAMPDPDDYDYSQIKATCDKYKDKCNLIGHPGWCDIMNGSGMICSTEQVYMDLFTEAPACMTYVNRKIDIHLGVMERTLAAAKGGIDVFWLGEDLGTQAGPLISLDMFRKILRPHIQKFVDLAKSYNLPVMIHSCGSSSWAFEDYIEMGVDIVDTLQPEAKDMSPAYLKEKFGDRLAFHGCFSTAGPVAYGSVQDTVDDIKNILEVMMPSGGYAFAPTHSLQDNSKTENALAAFDYAYTHGRY